MDDSNMNAATVFAHRMIIIAGIIMYIFGLCGNLVNIFIFTIWCRLCKQGNEIQNNTRINNSSFYLLTSSCANFILLIYPLLTRIIYDGFQYPKTHFNEFYTCKLRYYVLHTSDLISLTCICMATLDRYFISSRKVHFRQLAPTLRQTKRIIIFVIIFFCLHNIPIATYYGVSDFNECIISSTIYLYYYLCIIQIFLHGIFPICFLSIFGFLTYKQFKSMIRSNTQINLNIDKQLSRMLSLLCLSISISSIPYCIQNIHSVIFRKFNQRLISYDLLFYFISAILFFSNAVWSFYIFFISTSNFRQQVKKILLCKVTMKTNVNNRIHTIGSANKT
ncbi:hypothetical protein I4U23_021631 [Adineta vaga]|nr:hypothetical protein I4U23_021631 [Adineta vaga]